LHHAARVQSIHDLVTGRTLYLRDDRTALRFLRVDPQAPGLMPPHPMAP
jgi:hypothetical protein